jgi:hypothetical protein
MDPMHGVTSVEKFGLPVKRRNWPFTQIILSWGLLKSRGGRNNAKVKSKKNRTPHLENSDKEVANTQETET